MLTLSIVPWLVATTMMSLEVAPVAVPPTQPATEPEGASSEPAVQSPPKTRAEVTLEVVGNQVLADEVYQTMVAGWLAHEIVAAQPEVIAAAVLRFLHDAGYRLAEVRGNRIAGDRIRLEINEGRVARVVFRGPSAVDILQMKVQVSVPYDVYNARNLERQLAALEALGLAGARVQLITLPHSRQQGLALGDIAVLQGPGSVAPALPYELHVIMAKRDWEQGMEMHVDYDSSAGAIGGLSYAGRGLVFADDRWRLGLDLGATYFEGLAGQEHELQLSKASLDGIWYSPALLVRDLRPSLRPYIDLQVRQRRDLVLQTYDFFQTGIVGRVDYSFFSGLRVSVHGGFEYRQMGDVDQLIVDPPLAPVRDFKEVRAFAGLELDLVFDPDEPRLDRRHSLRLQGRRYIPDQLYAANAAYQHIFEWGWHDLWLRLGGSGMFGQVGMVDELAIDVYLRGMFNHTYWVEWVGAGSFEFRYSIRSDVLKVSAFADLALFEDPGRGRRDRGLKLANGSGLGLHTLIADLIQVDFYIAVGFASDGTFDAGIMGQMSKAF